MGALALVAGVLHLAVSGALLAYAALQLRLALAGLSGSPVVAPTPPSQWPRVTVQLPLYNERAVAPRLLAAVAALEYPRDRLQIQVLDDSTDDTVERVAASVAHLASAGLDITHVRRGTRDGYKAGALQHGLRTARGELVAILDADFVPPPDFLLRLVPHFADPRVGMVQARWGHLNARASLLTRTQAFLLDTHFTLEQRGRSRAGRFINFNGSAGLWRVRAIRGAGGWSAATLTEDLDLSYRAQLGGWSFVYAEDVLCPAELPADLRAFRIQQHRWMKGVAENARRLLLTVLRAPLPWGVRLHAAAHLVESAMYLVVLALFVLSALLGWVAEGAPAVRWILVNPLLVAAVLLLAVAYAVPRGVHRSLRALGGFAGEWVTFFVITTGLALGNALAVLDGYAGRRTPFVRTPKGDAQGGYRTSPLDRRFVADVVVWVALAASVVRAAVTGVLPFAWLTCAALAGTSFFVATGIRDWLGASRASGPVLEPEPSPAATPVVDRPPAAG